MGKDWGGFGVAFWIVMVICGLCAAYTIWNNWQCRKQIEEAKKRVEERLRRK